MPNIFVGKDAEVVFQVRVKAEPQTIPGAPFQVTVDNTPISDSDLDCVSDELAHVTVIDDGDNPITPASLVDSTGVITFNGADTGKNIFIDYYYDSNPYIVQEIRLEPDQSVQGIDGLGSDEIQVWAALLKNWNGSIIETFRGSYQLHRLILSPDNRCLDINNGSGVLSPGAVVDHDADKAIDGDDTTYASPTGTPPYSWDLEVTFGGGHQRIDKVTVTMLLSAGHNSNLKISYYDGHAWQDFATLTEGDFTAAKTTKSYILEDTWAEMIRLEGDLDSQPDTPEIYELEAYRTEIKEYNGIVVTWTDTSEFVRVMYRDVVFNSYGLPKPKNAPIFLTSTFSAKSGTSCETTTTTTTTTTTSTTT